MRPRVVVAFLAATFFAVAAASHSAAREECDGRTPIADGMAVRWLLGPAEDRDELDRWCRAVGPPQMIAAPPSTTSAAPTLASLVVVTWNVHLGEGRVADLVADLGRGRWTDGQAVTNFVLLVQEAVRRGHTVPPFASDARAAFAILDRDQSGPDVTAQAAALHLALAYVPSMRNGADLREDRGSAIFSTVPLTALTAVELPLERQRRVAVGAAIDVTVGTEVLPLRLMTAHLEPLSAPSSLWFFRNPRRRQVTALLEALARPAPAAGRDAGAVLGGDFNTIQGGDDEEAYARARAWGLSVSEEDTRATHAMGRLDYLFARLLPGWSGHTLRLDETYGSDHHPVLMRFRHQP